MKTNRITGMIAIIAAVLLVSLPASAKYTGYTAFLSTAVDILASATATNGSEFTSIEVQAGVPSNDHSPVGLVTLEFTRSGAGSASTIEVHMQVYNGAAWTTADVYSMEVGTNEDNGGSGSTVRAGKFIYLYGVQRIRLYKIVNNDSGTNLTNVNVTISI